jgi:hypothetical protein
LLFSGRTPGGSNGQRAWSHYTPGGVDPLKNGAWSTIYRLPAVPDPVCQASVIQWKSTHPGHPREWLLFSNPAGGGRTGGTIRLSQDGGLTWPHSRLLYAGSYAYSCLTILDDGSIGVFFERDDYTKITFARVEEGWLLNYDLDSDGDQMPDVWETLHGLNASSATDGASDADGDGASNREEFHAGTDPSSAASRLRVTGFSPFASPPQLSFASVPQRRYRIEQSENLQQWFALGTITADQALMNVEIPEATLPRNFFRVRSEP